MFQTSAVEVNRHDYLDKLFYLSGDVAEQWDVKSWKF